MREFYINGNEAGQRFDKYLKKLLSAAPNGFLYKMLRKKNIVLNGKRADGTEKLCAGDQVKLFLSDETFETFSDAGAAQSGFAGLRDLKPAFPLTVIYEDADVIVIDKPAGMLSQKAAPSDLSANEYILHTLIARGELTEQMFRTFRPSVCNRLDRNTSGLLIAGKTLRGLQETAAALKDRSIQKYYRCLVKGEVKECSRIDGWLFKDARTNRVTVLPEAAEHAVRIETEYVPVRTGNGYSELEVHLITGRSHQIRAHLASVGHPILGDFKYGDPVLNRKLKQALQVDSQMLHAYRMVFSDGREFTAPCGEEFERVWRYLVALM